MAWDCDTCGRTFGSWQALNQHMNAVGHEESPFQFGCDQCSFVFKTNCCSVTKPTQNEIKKHEAELHFWCSECKRGFQSANNMKMHLNSRVHRGKSISCPCCKSLFATAAGLAHHLETGSCPKAARLNRDEVYKLVRRLDDSGLIAKKLIGWEGSTTYQASSLTWNGDYFECYFCHRLFNSLQSLNQHLQSPIHQQKLYHCPNRTVCKKEFTTLAGVCNHLESESCKAMRFEAVQRHFQEIMKGDRLIGYP
ncbi:hypothetical protein ONZ43_g1493 [Nemania bipapillata]|uniref:Uncharacterized protein n=1 Tax=Nemania bipapillata TaxID=110536 RepID=A0ACC2J463_9PEZI|nr:hypothetical protein ONZ43_g1493 [Nemania bipapillata]